VPPVRGHLTSAVCWVVFRADRRQQHLERRHTDGQAERAIAIVRKEPVVAAAQVLAGSDEDRLVTGNR
jgi:hypothetical protein